MIDSFSGEYRFLSNFYTCFIEVQGKQYRSVEHAYQAAKAITEEDHEFVRLCESAATAKKRGQMIKIRSNWDQIKETVMLGLLRNKFSDQELRDKLMATYPQKLVEGNNWGDTYWGVCKGKGRNRLGELLMQVRAEILHEETSVS